MIDIFKSLYNIEDLKENYPLEYLDCFEHPIAINYNWLNSDILDLYYSYSKLYVSFSFDIEGVDQVIKSYESELGIRCNKVAPKENFFEVIIQLINEGHLVLIPGNLKCLFYSGYYMKSDWGHLFIIKGYDDEKKIFYIFDSIQEKDKAGSPIYTDFVMRFNDLYDIFEGFRVLREPYIYYLEDINSTEMYQERLKEFFEQLYKSIEKQQYMEHKILKELRQAKDQEIKVDNLCNIPKYKTMMLLHVAKIMKKLSYDVSNLECLADELEELWKQNNKLFIRKLLKNTPDQVEYAVSEKIIETEKKLLSEIRICINFLSKPVSMKDIRKEETFFENNQDNIISYNEGKFIFDFNNGKTYNTWIADQCPKVIIYKGKALLEKFHFQVKCKIEIDFDKEGHQEGIYVKTDHNNMYTFAIDYIKELVFDNAGRYTIGTYDYSLNEREVNLYCHLDQKVLSYGVVLSDLKEKEIGTIEFFEKAVHIGFFCKTWEKCRQFKVSFSDYKMDLK